MCDTYCKKRAAEQRTYPSKKTKVLQIDEQATSSSGPNLPDGNERLQPCAGLEDTLINAVPTPIQYCKKITLQPEELLVYSLVSVALPPGTNREWIAPLLSPNHSLYIVKLLE